MAETAPETTVNDPTLTENHDHTQTDLHEIGRMVTELHILTAQAHTMTEEMHREFMKWKPHLESMFNGPAARWKARRHASQAPAAPPASPSAAPPADQPS